MNSNNSVFDITKFVLCFFVLAIHTSLFPELLYPWLRLAVPLFFIMSAYFFFSKIKSKTNEEKRIALKKYIFRNLRLYFFYFVLLLPFTLYIRGWFSHGVIRGLSLFFRDLLFHSTFRASWFIMATVIATPIVYYMSLRIQNKKLFFITLALNVILVIRSSYTCVFPKQSIIIRFFSFYDSIFTPAPTSFPVALFWIVCGKIFAESDILKNQRINCFMTIASCGLLYVEWRLVALLGGGITNDCYLMLIPTCIFIFTILKNIKPRYYPFGQNLRKFSTMTYAIHATVATIVQICFKFIGMPDIHPSLTFMLTASICTFYSIFIICIEKRTKWKWLKYAY